MGKMKKVIGYAYCHGDSWGRVHVGGNNDQYGIYKKPFSKNDLKFNCIKVQISPIPNRPKKGK